MKTPKTLTRLCIAALLAGTTVTAIAGPTCTKEPQSQWLDQGQFKQQLMDIGYTIRKFKITSGNCYEMYGIDQAGAKKEIYFNPVTGKVVESH